LDRPKGDAAYEAVIKIRSLRVDQKAGGVPPRPMPGESRSVPNPDASRARQRLDEARATLRSMEIAVGRPCPACGAHPARALHCPRCKGTGNSGGITRGDLMRQRDTVRQLERDLATTPPLVRQPEEGGTERLSGLEPTKTAEMETQLLVVRVGTGRIVLDQTVRSRVEHADTASNDGRRLPSHEEIRAEVVAQMGREIFTRLSDRLVEIKLDEILERAEKAFDAGNARDSIEARVERIVLLSARDREKATEELDQLRRGERPVRQTEPDSDETTTLPPSGDAALPAAEHTWPILPETQPEGISI
jgi:hypothetical protein